MKCNTTLVIIMMAAAIVASCKKQLDVKNPNLPTPAQAATETGIISLAQGGVYVNGFRNAKYSDGVFGFYWSGAMGFQEIMGDVIGAEAANSYMNQIGCPDRVILDDGTVVLNPNSPKQQISLIREINTNSNQGANPLYYEWAYMYNMISACNNVLSVVKSVNFVLDGAAKTEAIQAWTYWWRGFAYSRIGSTYYAGVITNDAFTTNGNYVTKEKIIAESNANLDSAAQVLKSVADVTAFRNMMTKLIPDIFQVGRGGALTPDMWLRNINTLKARNILVNKTVTAMTATDWAAILTLVNDGIKPTDKVFTGRSNDNGDFISGSGTVAGKTQSALPGGNTYKLSERWVADFKPGDQRMANNVLDTTVWIGNSDRGNAFNTRYTLVNGGKGMPGVVVYANTGSGAYELYLAGNYEENELMKAEALINTNSTDDGLKVIDNIRDELGAGLVHVSGTGLTPAQAKEELRRERRVTLAFLGLSFYDARRWGVINPLSQGGGKTGTVVITNNGSVNTNATIEYNFLDYWDVPDNELVYNPPAAGSAATKNPK